MKLALKLVIVALAGYGAARWLDDVVKGTN